METAVAGYGASVRNGRFRSGRIAKHQHFDQITWTGWSDSFSGTVMPNASAVSSLT